VTHGREEWDEWRARRHRSARVPENVLENSPKRATDGFGPSRALAISPSYSPGRHHKTAQISALESAAEDDARALEARCIMRLLSSPFSGELARDYCVRSYRKKMTDTREYPQYFVKKG
jgi:hypothetical protein